MTPYAVVSGIFIAAIPIIQIGSYELNAPKHGYKHVYFNATWQTMCVWILTVFYMILGYEALKTFTSLINTRSLRPLMGIVFCISIYPHVFAWWACFNYYNDDFYVMLNHQVYFAYTEIISTYAILKSCDRNEERLLWRYCLIIGTAIVHILVAGPEEFFVNFLEGRAYQVWRDIGLASSDLVNIILPVADIVVVGKAARRLDQINPKGWSLMSAKLKILTMSSSMKFILIYCVLALILGYII